MTWDFEAIAKQIDEEIKIISDHKALESFRIKYLGRKGLISQMYATLATLPSKQKPIVGKNANILKDRAIRFIKKKTKGIKDRQKSQSIQDTLDITLPGVASPVEHRHILTQTIDEICILFEKLGCRAGRAEMKPELINRLNIPIVILRAMRLTFIYKARPA